MKQLNLFLENEEEKSIEWMVSYYEKGEEKFIGPYNSEKSAQEIIERKVGLSGPYIIPKNFNRSDLINPRNIYY